MRLFHHCIDIRWGKCVAHLVSSAPYNEKRMGFPSISINCRNRGFSRINCYSYFSHSYNIRQHVIVSGGMTMSPHQRAILIWKSCFSSRANMANTTIFQRYSMWKSVKDDDSDCCRCLYHLFTSDSFSAISGKTVRTQEVAIYPSKINTTDLPSSSHSIAKYSMANRGEFIHDTQTQTLYQIRSTYIVFSLLRMGIALFIHFIWGLIKHSILNHENLGGRAALAHSLV